MTSRTIISVVWLAAVWIVLWGQIDVRSVVGGLVIGALAVAWLPSPDPVYRDAFRPWQVLRFIVYYGWLVITSNAIVAWEVITPGSQVREGIVAVRVVGASDLVISLLAHAISGTPGTLIIDADRGDHETILYVHILHLKDIEDARLGILELQRRLVLAVGSTESLDHVEGQMEQVRARIAQQERR